MGGPIEKDKLHEFSWELHISEIKFEQKCNVIPIGKIKKGTFYHRALLFKVVEHIFITSKNILCYNIFVNEIATVL